MFDTRSGFWLLASIVITSVLANVAIIAFAPNDAVTHGTFATAIGAPMAVILPMIGILAVTGEWSQRTGLTTFTLVPHRGRLAALAVVVGGISALARTLVLADPVPGLAAGVLRGALGWGAAGLVVVAAGVSWETVTAREVGRAQRWHTSGRSTSDQLRLTVRGAVGRFGAALPAAAMGGLVATGAAQARADRFDLFGAGGPGWAFALAALAAPLLGAALGSLIGLAAPDRRSLAWGAAWVVVATVTVLLVRPFSSIAERASAWTPLGGLWPVTDGWSVSRRFALSTAGGTRAASTLISNFCHRL